MLARAVDDVEKENKATVFAYYVSDPRRYGVAELDAQGRVLLPMGLRQKAGMDKAIRFVGVGRYLEIWDDERFAASCAASEENIDSLLDYINDRYYMHKD